MIWFWDEATIKIWNYWPVALNYLWQISIIVYLWSALYQTWVKKHPPKDEPWMEVDWDKVTKWEDLKLLSALGNSGRFQWLGEDWREKYEKVKHLLKPIEELK